MISWLEDKYGYANSQSDKSILRRLAEKPLSFILSIARARVASSFGQHINRLVVVNELRRWVAHALLVVSERRIEGSVQNA